MNLNSILATFKIETFLVDPAQNKITIRIDPGLVTVKSQYHLKIKGYPPQSWSKGIEEKQNIRVKMNKQGIPSPIFLSSNILKGVDLRRASVHIHANLDFKGDRSVMVPAKGDARWFFYTLDNPGGAIIPDGLKFPAF